MRPVEGLRLGERYRLVRRLAIGGMGEVWVAVDDTLRREVAVKVLREEYTGNEDFLRRLRTEARNSSALVHRNIAQMYDYGEERGAGYLVMELVLGEPLADLLEREPVLAPARLLPILSQTARGLHAAHLAHVVHRDVKPGNILLEHSGTVKITDFGVSVAKNQVPMTATGMVMGTAQYLSPEQAVGQQATGASDIYALGVVAYEATAGRRPFTGRTPVDIAIAHVNSPVPPLPSSVHPGLSELIIRMLEKDPAHRFPSAEELARILDALAAEIAADPFGTARFTSRRARREAAPVVVASPQPAPPGPAAPPARVPQERPPHAAPAHAARASHHAPTFAPRRPPVHDDGAYPGAPGSDFDLSETSTGYVPSALAATSPPRAYPSRRDVRATTRSDIGRVDATGPGPAGRNRSSSTGGSRPGRRPASSEIGRRLGALGLSWPLVALVGLLVVVLVATLIANGAKDDTSDDRGLEASVASSRTFAEMLASRTASDVAVSGMMLPNEPRDVDLVATTPKDV
ncbi:serine/threonine-protein kinase [Antribacter gilvus]|uniref:serine/threonine-protein kinase n=1 Tax=Antribacter gilvus TaxID=2304675 RepID=UPI000F77B428|nr:serine/threonine-protein kinase [Antribacter gilvus]